MLCFSIYEKNHYDEAILFEKGTPYYLTRNALLLFTVIFSYYVARSYVSVRYWLSNEIEGMLSPSIKWVIYKKLFQFFRNRFYYNRVFC